MQPAPPIPNPNLQPGIPETIARTAAVAAGTIVGGIAVRSLVEIALPGAVTTTSMIAGAVVAGAHELYRMRNEDVSPGLRPAVWRVAKAMGKGALIGAAISFGLQGLDEVIGHSPFTAALGGGIAGGTLNGLREAGRIRKEQAGLSPREAAARVLKATGKGVALGGVGFGLAGGIGLAAEHASGITNADWLPWNGEDGGTGGGDGGNGGDGSAQTPGDESSPWAIKTGDLGDFDTSEDPGVQPEIDPETGFLRGTGSDTAALALQDSYSQAHGGAELNWEELRQDPGFESAYHDFMGNVLNDNGMEWGDDTQMSSTDQLTINEDTLDKFLDDMNVDDPTGDDLTVADFAPGEFSTPDTAAFLSHVDDYAASIAEHNPELASNPVTHGEYADGYLTYLNNENSALYYAYERMNIEAQMRYMADLLARLAEESDVLVGSNA